MKKKLILIITFALYFYLIPVLLLKLNFIIAIPFLLFTLLSINVGLFFTFILNKILNLNIYTLILFSSFLGLMIFTLTTLAWGQWGLKIDSTFLTTLYYSLSTLSFLQISRYIIYPKTKPDFKYKLNNFETIDLIFIVSLVVIHLYFVIIILNYYFIEYDSFTFWLTDAKIVYLTNFLRNSKNIINSVNYTSYYPLHSVYLFNLMGGLKEQYSAFITILFSAIASFLVYLSAINKNTLTKFLVGISLIIICLSYINNFSLIFLNYAEIISACFMVVFAILAIAKTSSAKELWIKIIVLSLILYAFNQIKYSHFYYTIILIVLYLILIDGKNLINLIKIKKRFNIKLLLSITIPFIILGILEYSKHHYFTSIWLYDSLDESPLPIAKDNPILKNDLSFTLKYLYTILKIINIKLQHVLIIYFAAIFIPLIKFKNLKNKNRILFIWLICLFLPASIILMYLIIQTDLSNMSINRYVTLSIYLLPLIFALVNLKLLNNVFSTRFYIIISTSIILFSFIFLAKTIPVNSSFHSGEYTDASDLENMSFAADEIKRKISAQDKILLVGAYSGYALADELINEPYKTFTNITPMLQYLRYFLFDYNFYGSYLLEKEEFKDFLLDTRPKLIGIILLKENKSKETLFREFFNIPEDNYINDINIIILKIEYTTDNKIKFIELDA